MYVLECALLVRKLIHCGCVSVIFTVAVQSISTYPDGVGCCSTFFCSLQVLLKYDMHEWQCARNRLKIEEVYRSSVCCYCDTQVVFVVSCSGLSGKKADWEEMACCFAHQVVRPYSSSSLIKGSTQYARLKES